MQIWSKTHLFYLISLNNLPAWVYPPRQVKAAGAPVLLLCTMIIKYVPKNLQVFATGSMRSATLVMCDGISTPGLGLGRNWDTHGSSHTLMDRPLFTWKHNHFSSRFFTFNIPFQHHDEIEAPEAWRKEVFPRYFAFRALPRSTPEATFQQSLAINALFRSNIRRNPRPPQLVYRWTPKPTLYPDISLCIVPLFIFLEPPPEVLKAFLNRRT